GLLVPGHRRRRQDDGIAVLNLDLAVVAAGDARQHRRGLALAAGRDQHHLFQRVPPRVFETEDDAVRIGEIAELPGDGAVVLHASPDERALPTVARGDVDRLLDANDVRGEGGHNDAARRVANELAQDALNDALRRGEPGLLDAGAVGEQRQDPVLADAR